MDPTEADEQDAAKDSRKLNLMSLFTSGSGSDITIVCDDKQWKLHKKVLAARCEKFKREIDQDSENEINEIIIAGDKDLLDAIFAWIYTREMPDAYKDLEDIKSVRMYKLAQKFELNDLIAEIEKELKQQTRVKAVWWQRESHNANPLWARHFVPEGQPIAIHDAIFAAYEHNVGYIKKLWVDFAEATMFWPVVTGAFDEMFQRMPAFADDVLRRMTERYGDTVTVKVPLSCSVCGYCPFHTTTRLAGIYVKVRYDGDRFHGTCYHCTNERPSLFEDCDEEFKYFTDYNHFSDEDDSDDGN
ncbi:hypothetical protein ABKA04_002041 [Annulohypoxylon sp. FPYF3050]